MSVAKSPDQKFKLQLSLLNGESHEFDLSKRYTVDRVKELIFNKVRSLNGASRLDYQLGFSRDSRLTVEFVKFIDCHEEIKKQFENAEPGEPVVVKLTLFPRSSKKLHRQLSVSALPSLRNATITHKKLGSFVGGGRVFDVPRTSIEHDAPMPEPIRSDLSQLREEVLGIPSSGGLSPRALKLSSIASSSGSAPPSAVKTRPTASEIFSSTSSELPLEPSPRDKNGAVNGCAESANGVPSAGAASGTSPAHSPTKSSLVASAPTGSPPGADSIAHKSNKGNSNSSVVSSTTPRSSQNGETDTESSDTDSDYLSAESSSQEEDSSDAEDRRTTRAASFSAVDLQSVSSKAGGGRGTRPVGGSSPEYEPILAMSPTQERRDGRSSPTISALQTRAIRNRSGSAVDISGGGSGTDRSDSGTERSGGGSARGGGGGGGRESPSPSSARSVPASPHTARSEGLGTIAEEQGSNDSTRSSGKHHHHTKSSSNSKSSKSTSKSSKSKNDGEKVKSKRKTKISSTEKAESKKDKKDKKDKKEKEKEKAKEKKDKKEKKEKDKHAEKSSLVAPTSPSTASRSAHNSPSSSLILTSSGGIVKPAEDTSTSTSKPKKPHKLEKASSALGTTSPKTERSTKRKKSGSMLDPIGGGSGSSTSLLGDETFGTPRSPDSGEQRDPSPSSPSPSVTPRGQQRRSRVLKKDAFAEGEESLGISHDSSSSSVPNTSNRTTPVPALGAVATTGSGTMNTSTSYTPGSGSTSGFASAHSPTSPHQDSLQLSRDQRDSKGSLGAQDIRDLRDLKEQLESTEPPQLSGRSRSTSKEKVQVNREPRELTPPRRGAGVISPPRVSSSSSSNALASSSTPHERSKMGSKSTSLTPPSTSVLLTRSVDSGAPGSFKSANASSGAGSGKLASSSTGDDGDILDVSDEDPFDENDPHMSHRLRISDDDMYSTIRRGSRPALFQGNATRMRSNSLLVNEVFAAAVTPSKMITREPGARPSFAEMRSGSFSIDSRASISRINRESAEMPEVISESKRKTAGRNSALRSAPPLMRPCRGFWVEVGRESISPELLLSEGSFPIENAADDNLWYAEYFAANPHSNYIGVDASGDVFVMSVIRPQGGNMIRALLRTKRGDERQVFVESKQTAKIFKSKIPVQEVLRLFAPSLGASKVRVAKDLNLIYDLMAFEERLRVRTYKFGVLLCKEGQTKEEEMFSNEYGSEEYDNFLNMLGETVRLKGFEKYRGGLDTERDSTGSHSVYTQFEGNEIMFHVSTMLPFSTDNPQQLERKRHLGNDIVVLVFKEGNTPYIPNTISSDFIHVIGIVQPEIKNDHVYYRLSIASKDGVPPFSPALPTTGLFEPGIAFRNLILTKLINGERAAYKSPAFSGKFQRTRGIMLKDIDDRFK